VNTWYLLIIINIALIFLIFFLISYYEKASQVNDKILIKLLRYWYPMVLILYIFKQVYIIIYSMNLKVIDFSLIDFDRWIFGTDPTIWIYKFANPMLTEFLQVIYLFYYILIVAYAIELYGWRRYNEFFYATFIIIFGFYLSYILYIFFPAIGPRFYLHDFFSISKELPGIVLTEPIRIFLNIGESIPSGVTNPQDFVQRDAFPSLHAQIAIILVYLTHKIKSKTYYFYLPYCILMMIATVYLRYHYVVDLIAGGVMAVITIVGGNYFYKIIHLNKTLFKSHSLKTE
jgi:membrane-associated phospholipid phosphatase